MRLRSTAAVVVLTAAVTLPLTGTALAADTDCADYPNQAAAQVVLTADPSDPNGLDGNDNGVACEDQPYGSTAAAGASTPTGGQVVARPAGAVAAGDGSGSAAPAVEESAQDPAPYVLGGLALSAAAGASFAARRARARA